MKRTTYCDRSAGRFVSYDSVRSILSEMFSAEVGKTYRRKMRWECYEKACFISCGAQFSVCFMMSSVKIVLESTPGPSVCTHAGFAALGAARSGTSDIDHRKPGVCGVHDLDNSLIGYRAVESELFGFLIQQGWMCHFPSDKSSTKVCEFSHRDLDRSIWGCLKYKPKEFPDQILLD